MDIDALHSTLFRLVWYQTNFGSHGKIFPLTDTLLVDLGNLLDQAEGDLRVAKATLAHELGFRLCPRCWPPELIASDRNGRAHCPACNQISYEKAA